MLLAIFGMLLIFALPILAQESTTVTLDEVNQIAKKLYCPVCPNETLDACQTQACVQWRAEIGDQLAQGQSEQEVIDSFVRRYGDRVLGTPQDPALRALSLVTPFVIAGLALVFGVFTFLRLRRRPNVESGVIPDNPPENDDYRDLLERDLRE
jgi:cytochrome c-type biogenesis protein CcmH